MNAETATEQKPGYCTLCRSRCGTINTVRGNALVAVKPDPSHPTGVAMCMKGRAAPELVHSPHRVLHPMRRTRPKTDPDPGWERISWEEALAEVADRLAAVRRDSGPEAVVFAVTTPSGTPLSDSIEWIERFVRLFGSPNICYGTEVCNWHKDVAHEFTFGCGMPVADYANTDLVLLWGHNPTSTWLAQANAIERGRAAGARLMVVDPRPTSLATQADSWLAVRPGTDAALALGLIRQLIRGEQFDVAFVREWTNAPLLVRTDTGCFLRLRDIAPGCGKDAYVVWNTRLSAPAAYDTALEATSQGAAEFALRGDFLVPIPAEAGAGPIACTPAFELLARQCEPFAPGRVADITGVPAAQVEAAGDLLARSTNVAYHAWTGVAQHTNATQTERAIATLYALLGCFDRSGGNRLFGKPPHRVVNALELLDSRQQSKALGLEQRPLGPPAQGWVTARDTYRAILEGNPYRVRAMMAFGTNLPIAQADTALAQAALAALEFCVHCDLFETPAARYADILLPINTPWEREGLRIGFEIDARAAAHVQLRPRMVPPRGESRSDIDVIFDLAPRLGFAAEFFGGSIEAGWNHMLEPLGLSVAQLREHPEGMAAKIDSQERRHARRLEQGGVAGFDTETRRVELYSERLLRHGYPPLPVHIEPAESPLDPERTQNGRFPYVLSSAKNGYYCHSQHRSLPSLRRRAPYPVVEIAESLAAEKGIGEGDWVRISTRIGRARFVARVLRSLAHGVVVAEHGWWQACSEVGQNGYPVSGQASSNFNALISADDCDPISGSVAHRSFLCDIEMDPDLPERQRGWAGWRRFRVEALELKAQGVLEIRFEAEDGLPLPDYLPGQHLQIRLKTSHDAEPLVRAYSLTGAAELEGRRSYTIAVRLQAGRTANDQPFQGEVSGFLHHALKAGDVVELTKPSGSFALPRDCAQPVVMIAGGIGITPFIGLLETLRRQRETPDLLLYYANQNGRHHAFRQRIAELAGEMPRLRVVNHYRAPLFEDRLGLDYDSAELIAADAIDPLLIERRARFYLCGPQPMMDALRAGLLERGVPAFDIFSEAFRSPAAVPVDGLKECKVTFSKSGGSESPWTPACGTLLQFGESLGVAMPSGCRVGQCESCAVRILSGRVMHLSGAEPEDPAMCLACQAVPLGNIVLDA